MNIVEYLDRIRIFLAEWIANHLPWYIRLVAGQQADEVFRRISKDVKKFHDI